MMDEFLEELKKSMPDAVIGERDVEVPEYTLLIDKNQWAVRFVGPDIDTTIRLDYKNRSGVFLCEEQAPPIPASALLMIHQLEQEGYTCREPVQTVYIDPEAEGEDWEDAEVEDNLELLLFNVGNEERFGFLVQGNVIISPFFIDEVKEVEVIG